jgi:hypothetical protein
MVSASLRVLTYNVWDIPVAKNRAARIAGIAAALRANDDRVDVVALLECWIERDRNALIAAGREGGLAHHVFFRSGCGFPGGQSSGLVVLSRWPVEETLYHRFSAAGKAQKILHWDYSMYSGKGVGLARLRAPAPIGPIDCYLSHFVAYYTPMPECSRHDEYVFHRRLGAWEAAQFIRATRRPGALQVCAVDLNADPHSLPYRALAGLAGMRDAWAEAGRVRASSGQLLTASQMPAEEKGLTCNYDGNCYFENNPWLAVGEPQARVDYLLFSDLALARGGGGAQHGTGTSTNTNTSRVEVEWCERRFTGPRDAGPASTRGGAISLSDHAAVLACLRVHDAGEREREQLDEPMQQTMQSQSQPPQSPQQQQPQQPQPQQQQQQQEPRSGTATGEAEEAQGEAEAWQHSRSAKHLPPPVDTLEVLVALRDSAKQGLDCALLRRQQAITMAYTGFALSLAVFLAPALAWLCTATLARGPEPAAAWTMSWGQRVLHFGLCAICVVWSCICFVLANITIPEDESAMIFMVESVQRRIDTVQRAHA